MLYKYLSYDGFEATIRNNTIMFSNINAWRAGSSNDIHENFIASCIESEEDFLKMIDLFRTKKLNREDIYKWMYYLCLYTYNTYASCFSDSIDNRDYMWNAFTPNGGACICFYDNLFVELERKYSKNKISFPVYSFMKGLVKYEDIPSRADDILNKIGDTKMFKKIAYFTKLKEHEKECEVRIAITEHHLSDNIVMDLIGYAKDYDCTFKGLRQFIANKMGIDITNKDHRYLVCEIINQIDHVAISPNSDKNTSGKIRDLCNEFGLKIQN